ncbi:MAG: hypothetical protein ACR2OU_15755 [Thermomicrobiales bacterium]
MSAVVRELHPEPEKRTTSARAALWFGVLGGIASWAAHLGISWALVPYVFRHDDAFWLHVTTVIAVIVTLAAAAAWSAWRQVRTADSRDPRGRAVETDRFMSLLGLVTSTLFLVLILVESAGTLVLGPGRLW